VIKEHPPRNDITPFFHLKTGTFTDRGKPYVEQLREELSAIDANIFVPMGNTALAALTGKHAITTARGYVYPCTLNPGRKVLPTIHPASCIRGQYLSRYFISHDLKKAHLESAFPSIDYPHRDLIVPTSFVDAVKWLRHFQEQSHVTFDIEVANHEVSCLSFCSDDILSVSVPFLDCWTEQEEVELWYEVAKILENPEIAKGGQNIMGFDIAFLAMQNSILVRGPLVDTMIGHHIVFPDFPKSLAFLASIYSRQPFWKDMVKFKIPKKEA